jgi:hypothetical protein
MVRGLASNRIGYTQAAAQRGADDMIVRNYCDGQMGS